MTGVEPLVELTALRKATIERVGPALPGFTPYWQWPDITEEPLDKPAVLTALGYPPADYETTTFGGATAEWHLIVTLVVDGVDDEAAQAQLGALVTPRGPVVRALRSRKIQDTLSRLARMVRVTTLSAFAPMLIGGDRNYYAEIRVAIQA